MDEPRTAVASDLPTASPAPRRRRLLAWVLSTAVVILVLGGLTALELTAWQGFDEARTAQIRAAEAQDSAAQQARAALALSREATTTTDEVLAVPDAGLMSETDRAALTAADTEAAREQKAANAGLPTTSVTVPERPFWFWDANDATVRLRVQATDARRRTKTLTTAEDALDAATKALHSQAVMVLSATADRAAAAEAANVPAANEHVLALRSAAADVKSLTQPLQSRLPSAYSALTLAVRQLQDSHAATLAAESGPLEQSRLDLEAFARSLAPGILMDFEWADLVNGLGESNGYLSGETSWQYDRGGYATIRLSNSIAADWPSDAAHAIVAHEVGHAMTIRCRTMYDTSDSATTEAWATAWAISMGFTSDANGTSAYGSPPDSLVQKAASCR